MNKTLRNKVLKNVNRLITAEFNGENWVAPDGYFATAYPIYEGYRVKKDQTIPEFKPDLNKVLPTSKYKQAKKVEKSTLGDYIDISINDDDIYTVNADYYTFLKGIYPDARVYVDTTGNKYSPVFLKIDDVLVAVIMPIKK